MDCQMPGLDGIATTVELRQLEGAGPRTPVVALSAAALPADRERCRLAGMDGFLAKPIRLDQLAGELARFLSARGSETMPPVIAQAAGAVPPPALDAQVVATLRSLDDRVDGFVAMVNGYLREANQTIATLVIDAMSGRREGLGQRAHAMKGAALTMGLTRLAMALDAFERIAHHGDDQALASAGDDLDQAFAEATSALRAECERAPRPSAN
jgi:CheY-like chemotaxis protein